MLVSITQLLGPLDWGDTEVPIQNGHLKHSAAAKLKQLRFPALESTCTTSVFVRDVLIHHSLL